MAIPDIDQLCPAFGLLPDIAWGVDTGYVVPSELSIPDSRPPEQLLYLHDPWFFQLVWRRLLEGVRQPVRVHEGEDGRRLLEILGDIVVEQAPDGQLSVSAWECLQISQPNLVKLMPHKVVLQGMPWRSLWLDAMRHGAAQEFLNWASRSQNLEPALVRDHIHHYAMWAFARYRQALRSHCDLRVMRQRIARALQVDPWVQQVATRLLRESVKPQTLMVAEYNLVLRHRAAFASLWREAPHLVPVFGAFCEQEGFPAQGEAMAQLKAYLLGQGISGQTWRLLANGDGRIFRLYDEFYEAPVPDALLDLLRCMSCLGARTQPPLWLLRVFFNYWGHRGERRQRYLGYFSDARVGYAHILESLRRHFGWSTQADAQVLDALELVLRWECDCKNLTAPDPMQRKAGWPWLLRQARQWELARTQALQLAPDAWTVPMDSIAWEGLTLVPLTDALALWEEGRAMKHCASKYVEDCRSGAKLILSVRRGDVRICTLGLERNRRNFDPGYFWQLWQATGKANTPLHPRLLCSLKAFVVHQNAVDRTARAKAAAAAKAQSEQLSAREAGSARVMPQTPEVETEEDGIRAGALRIARYKHQNKQFAEMRRELDKTKAPAPRLPANTANLKVKVSEQEMERRRLEAREEAKRTFPGLTDQMLDDMGC